MDSLRIRGPAVLSGSVRAQGAKNAALPIMAASLLASEPVTLHAAPRLADVDTLALVLAHLGLNVSRRESGGIDITTLNSRPVEAPCALVEQMRASFCVLGPLVARRRVAIVPLPGGCDLGPRPIDLHLAGLVKLGAEVRIERGMAIVSARRLRGATIELAGPRGPTVTGTANVLSAATLAQGTTVIRRAAREPEIADLACFLRRLGADIEGEGTDTLVVRGREQLGGAEHQIIPDRIEAGTLLFAAAITGSTISVEGARAEHLSAVLETLALTGQRVELGPDVIRIAGVERPRGVHGIAGPFPEFPTDLQPMLTALLAKATSRGSMTDRVFPERWRHLAELEKLGARFSRQACRAATRGGESQAGALLGAISAPQRVVQAHDLRGGAALLLAALAAEGTTLVTGLEHLDRGYERIEDKLRRLGADIARSSAATLDEPNGLARPRDTGEPVVVCERAPGYEPAPVCEAPL